MATVSKYLKLLTMLVMVALAGTSSIAFSFIDGLSGSDTFSSITVGTWEVILNNGFVDFEDFTNTSTGQVNDVVISGITFDLFDTVVGDSVNDVKFGTKSGRVLNGGHLTTKEYYTGLTTFSFYRALAQDSDNKGSKKYILYASNNGADFTVISEGVAGKDPILQQMSVDLGSMLAAGISMPDGSTATATTPLQYRIEFYVSVSSSVSFMNVDDISFS